MSNIAENLVKLSTDKTDIQSALINKGITNAMEHGFDDFAQDITNIQNSYTLLDEGKVVNNGTLINQTTKNITENGTIDTTTNNTVQVNVPNNLHNTNISISTRCIPLSNKYMPNSRGFVDMTWNGYNYFDASEIWADGDNIYISYKSGSGSSAIYGHYVLNKSTSTWVSKTWKGFTKFTAYAIWTYNNEIYCSYGSNNQYVLDKTTSTWSAVTWSGISTSYLYGSRIWTDGSNIYCSYSTYQYVLNKSTMRWETKTWTGLTSFSAEYIWTDGTDIYYSSGSTQKVLDIQNSNWIDKTWSGRSSFSGKSIWTDGDNIYCSSGANSTYVLKNSTWILSNFGTGISNTGNIWSDGSNIYCSNYVRDSGGTPVHKVLTIITGESINTATTFPLIV